MPSSESELDYGDESGSSSEEGEEASSDEEEEEDPPPPSKVYDSLQDAFECPQVQEETNKYGCGTALVHDVKTGSVTKLAFFENNATKDRLKLVCSWCKAMLQISSWDCHFKKCYARQQLLKRQQKMDEERKKIKAKKKRKREQQKKEAKKKDAKKKVSKPTKQICCSLSRHPLCSHTPVYRRERPEDGRGSRQGEKIPQTFVLPGLTGGGSGFSPGDRLFRPDYHTNQYPVTCFSLKRTGSLRNSKHMKTPTQILSLQGLTTCLHW